MFDFWKGTYCKTCRERDRHEREISKAVLRTDFSIVSRVVHWSISRSFQCCSLRFFILEEFPPDLISKNACLSSLGPRWQKALSQRAQEAGGKGGWHGFSVGKGDDLFGSWDVMTKIPSENGTVPGGPYHVWCFDEHLSERLRKHEGERMFADLKAVSCLEFRDGLGWNLFQNCYEAFKEFPVCPCIPVQLICCQVMLCVAPDSGAIDGCQVINGWKAFICYSSFSGWLYNRRTTSQTKRGCKWTSSSLLSKVERCPKLEQGNMKSAMTEKYQSRFRMME